MAAELPRIVQVGDPVLREPAADVTVEELATPEFQALVRTMVAVMRAAPGVGLAAPQLGVSKRVFVMEDPPEFVAKLSEVERTERGRVPVPLRTIVNPVLRPVGDAKVGFFEGCLSLAGYVGFVERWAEVEVTGLDETGAPVSVRLSGWPARILQHETDHLAGTLYVDRMVTRSFSTAETAKVRFGGRPVAEIRRALGLD